MQTFDDFKIIYEKNRKRVLKEFEKDCSLVTSLFDKMQFLIDQYSIRFILGIGNGKNADVMLSTLVKSMYNLHAVIDLTQNGNIGPARIIIRNIFEFLVMGKYILLHDDHSARVKWDNLEYINIDRRIFQNTIYPDNESKEAFIKWWTLLCQYAHATRASGQESYEYDDIKAEINMNLTFILMLLAMLYSYMNKFLVTPYFKNYLKSLAEAQPNNSTLANTIEYQQFLKKAFRYVKSILSSECEQILNYYSANWRIKQPTNKLSANKNEFNSRESFRSLAFQGAPLENRVDIFNYLNSFIQLYKESIEGVDEAYRKIVLKYLIRFKKLLQEYSICEIKDKYLLYHYMINII